MLRTTEPITEAKTILTACLRNKYRYKREKAMAITTLIGNQIPTLAAKEEPKLSVLYVMPWADCDDWKDFTLHDVLRMIETWHDG